MSIGAAVGRPFFIVRTAGRTYPKRTVDAETMNIGAAELNGTNRDEV
jgi:hypothetical protein